DCYLGMSLQDRQLKTIGLYESIKEGYKDSPILVWFDDDGFIRLYDGYHRLSILKHLNKDIDVTIETEWQGIDGSKGRDFPLVEVLMKEHPYGEWTYQPVEDRRLDGWNVDRQDSAQRLKYILENLSGETVLDIGCSEGYFSRELAKRGYKVTGVDKSRGLVAVARYMSTIQNLDIEYKVGEWSDLVTEADNVLFLSVIHNDMKQDVNALDKLSTFKGKAKRLFFEVPNNQGEREWNQPGFPNFNFHSNLDVIGDKLGMGHKGGYQGLRSIYLFDRDFKKTALDKWMLPERTHYQPLFDYLKTHPCRNIMEIGVYKGETAVVMVKTAAELVPENEINYYGFDLFEERTREDTEVEFSPLTITKESDVSQLLTDALQSKSRLFKGDTRVILPKVADTLPKMDLIYIDGGHSIETTRSDWNHVKRLMHENTAVFFDDYDDEMPFMGSRFIVHELGNEYRYEVCEPANYYRRQFGRLKSQLLKVTKRKFPVRTDRFRFHLLGLPHSKTTKDWVLCPFTQLTYKMSKMLSDMGHEVIHYGTEGSNPECSENVTVLTEAVQKQAYGDWEPNKQLWIHNGNDLAYTTFRKNAIAEINKRKEPKDLLLVTNGTWLQEVADKTHVTAIEPFVGYLGHFAKYKVFPSYAWMHYLYGLKAQSVKWNLSDGNWYYAVIPHYFDVNDFKFEADKEDYFLYCGRLIKRKGCHIAGDLTKRIGAKLKVIGQVMWPDRIEESLSSVGLNQPHVEYLGAVGREERNRLMGKAKAVIIPSVYMEPFGKVVVEALLCGTPVITTDWGSFPEIVKHGEVGYRCRTMGDFIWAANHIDNIDPEDCRKYASDNYSIERISKMYQEYFSKVYDLFDKGWYQERTDMDWLRRY
ncbi:MAG: glycosyltransferase, partial [Dehalococcoidales bacterium]|nr:glycosyltransferase [Dehalococcoidales bacterium]